MTCIVGVRGSGEVWIGADSAGVCDTLITSRADPKVCRVGSYLFGFTDSFRMGDLLRFDLAPPNPSAYRGRPSDAHGFMVREFVPALRACFDAGGFSRVDRGREEGGTFLVGFGEHLFGVYSDLQIERSREGYVAVGSGAAVALGALHATRRQVAPRRRVVQALEAAAAHNTWVAPPFVLRHT